MKKKIIPLIATFLLILLVAAASAEARSIFKIGGDVTVEADQKVDTVIDIGGKWAMELQLARRARQNVVFEHGYLMSKLGRNKVEPVPKVTVLQFEFDAGK